jgi:14-3-3 protein epsilon
MFPSYHIAGLMNFDLSVEERNMFSIACKNSVSSRRASLRILASIESKEEKSGDEDKWRIDLIK